MVTTLNRLGNFAPQSPETGNITAIVVAAAADSIIRTLKVPIGMRELLFDVTNTGANAFDQFEVQRRAHSSAAWVTLADTAGNFSSPDLPILEVQGAPVTLAAAAVVNIRMEVAGTEGVRIVASGDGATTATFNYRFGK